MGVMWSFGVVGDVGVWSALIYDPYYQEYRRHDGRHPVIMRRVMEHVCSILGMVGCLCGGQMAVLFGGCVSDLLFFVYMFSEGGD